MKTELKMTRRHDRIHGCKENEHLPETEPEPISWRSDW
jgi:hypothetical protein